MDGKDARREPSKQRYVIQRAIFPLRVFHAFHSGYYRLNTPILQVRHQHFGALLAIIAYPTHSTPIQVSHPFNTTFELRFREIDSDSQEISRQPAVFN